MTRNVYFGADVDIILEAEDLESIPLLASLAFAQLNATNFEERADALALEIEKTLPHLIGLQEMAKFYTQTPSDFLIGNPVRAWCLAHSGHVWVNAAPSISLLEEWLEIFHLMPVIRRPAMKQK